MKEHITAMLARTSKSLNSICDTLKEQLRMLKEESIDTSAKDSSRQVILNALILFLGGSK